MNTNTIDREPEPWTLRHFLLAVVGGLGFIAFAGFIVIGTWAIAGH